MYRNQNVYSSNLKSIAIIIIDCGSVMMGQLGIRIVIHIPNLRVCTCVYLSEYLPPSMQKQISTASLQQVLFYTVGDLISVQGQSPFI